MVQIKPTNLHWLEGGKPESDLCAHGIVLLTVCGTEIDTDGECCVSAAALYLLRTLNSDHNETNRVAEHLLPCCGHDMHAVDGEDDVTIIGCPNGFDWYVEHNDDATVTLSFATNGKYTIQNTDWVSSACEFSDSISRFYDDSTIKKPYDAYAENGYNAFRSEWLRRREIAG